VNGEHYQFLEASLFDFSYTLQKVFSFLLAKKETPSSAALVGAGKKRHPGLITAQSREVAMFKFQILSNYRNKLLFYYSHQGKEPTHNAFAIQIIICACKR